MTCLPEETEIKFRMLLPGAVTLGRRSFTMSGEFNMGRFRQGGAPELTSEGKRIGVAMKASPGHRVTLMLRMTLLRATSAAYGRRRSAPESFNVATGMPVAVRRWRIMAGGSRRVGTPPRRAGRVARLRYCRTFDTGPVGLSVPFIGGRAQSPGTA